MSSEADLKDAARRLRETIEKVQKDLARRLLEAIEEGQEDLVGHLREAMKKVKWPDQYPHRFCGKPYNRQGAMASPEGREDALERFVRALESLADKVEGKSGDGWLTLKDAVDVHHREDFPFKKPRTLYMSIRRACEKGEIRTNDRQGTALRIDRDSFAGWRIKRLKKDLDRAG